MENLNQQLSQFFSKPAAAFIFFAWIFFWKARALWRASSKRQLVWFILIMLVNTLGLLEIAYIFYLNRWDIDKGRLLAFLEKKFKKLARPKTN